MMDDNRFQVRLSGGMPDDLRLIVAWLADHGKERPVVGRGRRPIPTASDAVRFAIKRAADAIRRHKAKRLVPTSGK